MIKTEADATYLPFLGGTLRGNLNLDSNTLSGLPNPTQDSEAVSKKFLEDNTISLTEADKRYAKKSESTTGLPKIDQDLSMNNHKLTDLATPTNANDASSKAYCDSKPRGISKATADLLYLGLGGGTLKGDIHFENESRISNVLKPLNPLDCANKAYIDSKVAGTGGLSQSRADGRYLSLNGGKMKGTLNMQNNKIIGVAVPLGEAGVTNVRWVKSYVSNHVASKGDLTQATADNRYLQK